MTTRTTEATSMMCSISCMSATSLAVRARAVLHALPVRLAAELGTVAIAARARFVRLAARPRRGLGRWLAGPGPCPPLGCCLPAPSTAPLGGGLPSALAVGLPLPGRLLALAGLEIRLRCAVVDQ